MGHLLLHPLELLLGPLSTTVRARPEVALVLAGIVALALVRGTRRR
ncbi:MAG TPA: hypothetical protein VMV21_12300 [Vicinamibacteria bacterium]|nr:hypothetical protein [Vicinamibacteria bacterium]